MIVFSDREPDVNEKVKAYYDYDNVKKNAGVPQRAPKHMFMVADENGRMIGYSSGIAEHQWLFLSNIWVEETRRHQGVGSRLLKRIEDKARSEGIKHVYLWTFGPDNCRFYKKNGYYEFAVFENYYEAEGYHQFGFRKDL